MNTEILYSHCSESLSHIAVAGDSSLCEGKRKEFNGQTHLALLLFPGKGSHPISTYVIVIN